MTVTAIVTGPQGCGKSLYGADLARQLGCRAVVDDWVPGDALQAGALHLTHEPMAVETWHGARVFQAAALLPKAVPVR